MLHGKGFHNRRSPMRVSAPLSAPTIGYPSPLATNPTTIAGSIPADWQSGDVMKLARSASVAMTSPTILTHTITDTDITNGTFSIGLSGVTLSGITYFQAYGARSGLDSLSKSNITSWGDTTAPTITTSATASITETSQLAIALTGTDTGGIASWALAGGADQLCFEVSSTTLRWLNNGSQSYSAPIDQGGDNVYNVTVQAKDYGGNASTLAIAVTVTQIDTTPDAFTFTNVSNATLSTVYTSNTVTLSGLAVGFNISASVSGTGFTYSKNGGAYQAAGSFTVQNGDTLTLRDTSPSANNLHNDATITVGTYSTTWQVATPITTTTFNPSDTAATVTLSNGNLTASGNGAGPGIARTVNGYSTGKHAVQFHVDTGPGWYGIMPNTDPNNNYPSAPRFALAHDGTFFVGSGTTTSLAAPATNDVYIVAWDADAKLAWLCKNGTWQGTGGNPNASGPGFDISACAATLYPFWLENGVGQGVTLQAASVTNFTSVI